MLKCRMMDGILKVIRIIHCFSLFLVSLLCFSARFRVNIKLDFSDHRHGNSHEKNCTNAEQISKSCLFVETTKI